MIMSIENILPILVLYWLCYNEKRIFFLLCKIMQLSMDVIYIVFCDFQVERWHKCFQIMLSVLKLNIQKTKIMASGSITSWEIDGETVSDFIFLGSKITADGDYSHEIKRCLLLGRKVMTNLDSILKSKDITLPKTSIQSRLWFFQRSCMDVRVGL